MIKVLNDCLNELGLKVESSDQKILLDFFYFLIDYNKKVNLISSKQDVSIQLITHIVDSLTALYFDLPSELSYLDFGSGGGLPVIPLKIVNKKWDTFAAEATLKKCEFLKNAANNIMLNNFTVWNKYLEAKKNNENKKFDFITARGVSELSNLIQIAYPRLKSNAYFLVYKGPKVDLELQNAELILKKFPLKLLERKELTLPFINSKRVLLLFKK